MRRCLTCRGASGFCPRLIGRTSKACCLFPPPSSGTCGWINDNGYEEDFQTPFSLERVMQVERSTLGIEAQWRPRGNVIPAYAGIQEPGGRLDSRVRENDHHAMLQYVCTPKCITRSRGRQASSQ